MIRRWLLPFCMMLAPTHAGAGVRAAYSNGWGSPLEVAIDDRGNASIRYDEARRIIVANGETHIVEERLTGPVVIRAEDLDALLPPPRNDPGETLRQLGTREVDGRSGTAFGRPKGGGAKEDILLFVISPDPAFRPLGAAMARLLDAELLIGRWAKRPYQRDPSTLRPAIAAGAPLIFDGRRLRRLVHDDVAAAEVALPAPAMSREALAAWLKAEARARKAPAAGDTMILRAAYAGGRLWLLSQDGMLDSIVEGADARVQAELGAKVADICTSRDSLLALTASAGGWALQTWRDGRWESGRWMASRGDRPIALACDGDSRILLTNARVIDLDRRGDGVTLSGRLVDARTRYSVHAARDAVFVGANSGEWGGGFQRIDRRTGEIGPVETPPANGRCAAPLNGGCDVVNGIAPLPWRKSCLAVAVGLIHFFSSGKIVSVCPDRVDTLLARPVDPYDSSKNALAASKGGLGSIAYFGVVAAGDRLLAAGHDGLYQIGRGGKAERQPWPRFRRIGGVLVSFERPDMVLVMSEMNRRASVSGIAPLMVPR